MSGKHSPDPLRGIPLEALRGFEAAPRLRNFNRSMMSDWLWSRVSDYSSRHPEIDLRIAPAPRSGAPGDHRGLDDGMPPLDANWSVWCARAGVAPIVPAAWKPVPDWSLMFALAAQGQGQGVCLGRTSGVNDRLRQGLLVAPLPEVTLSTRAWYLVTSSRCKNDPHASAFVEWLKSEARREVDFAQVFLADKRLIGE